MEFERFTQRRAATLRTDPGVLGLLALGSTADASYRDEQSDHDFWVVVTEGAAARYRGTFDWLPEAAAILLCASRRCLPLSARAAQPEPLENLALVVWAGQERLLRGERLTAHRYLTGFAVDCLLELLRHHGALGADPTADRLDPRRRLERLAPDIAAEVDHLLTLPLAQLGAAVLTLAERRLQGVAPQLNWPAIAEVRRWC